MKYIFGNWKMNNTSIEVKDFIKSFKPPKEDAVFGIAVPFPYIKEMQKKLGKKAQIGAQNVSFAESGAYTGEISAKMLADCGASFCLVGHSERRQIFGETNEWCREKVKALQSRNIMPVLCIGETLQENEQKKTKSVLKSQLKIGLSKADFSKKIIIAYEPVWAIGTGKTPTKKEVDQTISYIKEYINKEFKQNLKVLYGGSVKASNAKELLSGDIVDGALIGGASLKVNEFLEIAKSAKEKI